jgi:ABC-type nitrate/sulfonate/bicarbonate transport system substrate-binding protein
LGFYEREGIDVEFLEGGVSADGGVINPLAVLARGDADVAIAWLSTALIARRGGSDLVNIAQIFRRPATWLVCRRDAGIQRAADIRGRSIGVWNVGDQYDVAFWRRVNGFTVSDATLVQQRPDGQDLIDLRIPCITAMAYNEYWKVISAGFAPAALFIIRFGDNDQAFLEDGLYARANALSDPGQVDRLARFLRASAAGWRHAQENFEESLAILLARLPPSANSAHQRRMLETVLRLADPATAFGLLDLPRYEGSVQIVGLGVGDPAGIETAARKGWTHSVWYAASRDALESHLLSYSVRHHLAKATNSLWFYALDLIGTAAFGFAGFMRAQQRRYDLWGAFILTMLPAVAGGTLRDLLVGGDRTGQ